MNAVIGLHAAAQQTSKWYWNHLDTSWNSEFPYLETIQYNMLHFLVASKNPWWQSVYPDFFWGWLTTKQFPSENSHAWSGRLLFPLEMALLFVVCSILVKYITCPHLKAWCFVYWISSISGPIFGIYIYTVYIIIYTSSYSIGYVPPASPHFEI